MKFVLIWVVIATPLFYLFGNEEYVRIRTNKSIAESPGYAPAQFTKVTQSSGKNYKPYYVHYTYTVDGRAYTGTTTPTDQQGAARYMTQSDVQVAYSTNDPSIATLKRYFDLRDPRESVWKGLVVTAMLSVGLALPIAFGIYRGIRSFMKPRS